MSGLNAAVWLVAGAILIIIVFSALSRSVQMARKAKEYGHGKSAIFYVILALFVCFAVVAVVGKMLYSVLFF